MNTTVNYINLLSACLSAAQQSAHVIVDTLLAGKNQSILNKKSGEYDPQTIADIGAQHIIQTGLGVTFPGIQIVGEEPQSSIDKYLKTFTEVPHIPTLNQNLFTTTSQPLTYLDNNANYDEKVLPTISTAFLPPIFAEFDITKLLIFIDPLDGTSEYTRGRKEHVTTLISITFDGSAVGGVLYYPFTGEAVFGGLGLGCYSTSSFKLRPTTVNNQIDAIAQHPTFKFICAEWLETTKQTQPTTTQQQPSTTTAASTIALFPSPDAPEQQQHRVVTSKSHLSQGILDYFIKIGVDFDTQVISLGGAGNKGAQVLKGVADAYLYPSSGTSRWDIGVIDGLFWAHGGKLTDCQGQLYSYNSIDKLNSRGCICTVGVRHEDYVVEKLEAGL